MDPAQRNELLAQLRRAQSEQLENNDAASARPDHVPREQWPAWIRGRELMREIADLHLRLGGAGHAELLAQLRLAQCEQTALNAEIAVYLASPNFDEAAGRAATSRRLEVLAWIAELHERLGNHTAFARAHARAETAAALEEARALNTRAEAALARSAARGRSSIERGELPRSEALQRMDAIVSTARRHEAALARARELRVAEDQAPYDILARERHEDAYRAQDDAAAAVAWTRENAAALSRGSALLDGPASARQARVEDAWSSRQRASALSRRNALQQRRDVPESRNDALDRRARDFAAESAGRSRYIPPPPGESLDEAMDRRSQQAEAAGSRRSTRNIRPPDRLMPHEGRLERLTGPPQRFQDDLAAGLWTNAIHERRPSIVAVPHRFAPPPLEEPPLLHDDLPIAELLQWAGAQAEQESRAPAAAGEHECTVCMDRPRSVLFTPCGHCIMCARCWQRVLQSIADPNALNDHVPKCPQCRMRVTHAHHLFPPEIQRLADGEDLRSGLGPIHNFRGVHAPTKFFLNARMPCACAAPCACSAL